MNPEHSSRRGGVFHAHLAREHFGKEDERTESGNHLWIPRSPPAVERSRDSVRPTPPGQVGSSSMDAPCGWGESPLFRNFSSRPEMRLEYLSELRCLAFLLVVTTLLSSIFC